MPKVEEIKVLNVDDKVLAVDAQSEEVKALVATYNEWNQDLADRQKEHAQIRAAVQALSQQIIHTIRLEKEKAEKKAADEKAAEEAAKVEEAAKIEKSDNVTPISQLPNITEEVVSEVKVVTEEVVSDVKVVTKEANPVSDVESLKENTLAPADDIEHKGQAGLEPPE